MKTNRHLLKIISVLLSVILLCSGLFINISAETEKVKVWISSKEYLSAHQIYSSQNEFSSGETVYLSVAISRVYGLGGLSFTVEYNSDALEFKKNSAICLIGDKESSVTYKDSEKSKITVAYFTGAYNVSSSTAGEIFLLPFVVKNLSSNATCNFSLKVKDLYDNTSWQNDIEFDDENAVCTVSAVSEGIPSDVIDAAAKLENIEYPDSKSDIDNALDLYGKLSAQQQSLFKTMHPSHYEWLTTAKERYNREAENAERDKVETEVNGFKQTHASVLALTVDTVKISDQAAIEAALKAYETVVAKSYLMNEAALITELSEKVEELIEIRDEINNFLTDSNFSFVWNESAIEKNMKDSYSTYANFFDLALLSYSMLSSGAKAELSEQYEYLTRMKKIADEYLENDEKAAELAAKVADFMQTYMYVFTRNENNVSIEDKAAINMVIQAYDRLEDLELKEALKDRISKLKLLLDVIDESELEDDEDSNNQPEDDADNSNNNTAPGNSESIVQKVTKVINNITNSGSKYSNTILYLFVLLGVSLVLLMVAYILGEKHKKFMDSIFYNGEEVEVAE